MQCSLSGTISTCPNNFGLIHKENSEGQHYRKSSSTLEPCDPITESAQREEYSPPPGPSIGSSCPSEWGSPEDKNLTACFLVMITQKSHSFIIILLREGSVCFCLPFVKSNLFLWMVKEINFPEMIPWWSRVHTAHSAFIDKLKVN